MDTSEIKIKEEIERLVDLIGYHNDSYFKRHESEISDYTYDQLLQRLSDLEAAYPHLKLPHSPTSALGESVSSAWKGASHSIPMLSLAKTYDGVAIAQFVEKSQKLANYPIGFVCEPKIDGISISLQYSKGQLVRVATRGDGWQGDDVTPNAWVIKNLPRRFTVKVFEHFEVRGEVFMKRSFFEAANKRRALEGEPLWANPRNIAAGTLKSLDRDAIQDRDLYFYGYSLHALESGLSTQEEVLQWIDGVGFSVAPSYRVCYSAAEIMDYIAFLEANSHILPVDIDGVVVKVNQLHLHALAGTTEKAPRWAIAYKYKPKMASSVLEQVTFHIGRTGLITPVAHFAPIALAGTMVKRASLHNHDIIMGLDLHLGDTIFVEKRGEIIPQVVGVDYAKRQSDSTAVGFIDRCPSCHTLLERMDGQSGYYCPNRKACVPQQKAALLHFASRKAMDIGSLGPKTIDLLFDAGLVVNIADIYRLRYEQVNRLVGFQSLSTQRLLANIEASKAKPFEKLFFALGIDHVGESVAKKVAFYFKDMAHLEGASLEDLLQVPDIGVKIARSILAYFQDPHWQNILSKLKEEGLQWAVQDQNHLPGRPLSSKRVVVTGIFMDFTREAMIAAIESLGGVLVMSVSSKVDYVVVGKHAGPVKLAKARALGITMLTEGDIQKMIR